MNNSTEKEIEDIYDFIWEQEEVGNIDCSSIRESIGKFYSGSLTIHNLRLDFETHKKESDPTFVLRKEVYESFNHFCSQKLFYKEVGRFVVVGDGVLNTLNEQQKKALKLDIAKIFSSFLTHALIQSTKQEFAFEALEVKSLSLRISEFINEDISFIQLRDWVKITYHQLLI